LNPVPVNNYVARTALTARVASLASANIYVIDVGWGGKDQGYTALGYIRDALKAKYPSATINLVRKPGDYTADSANSDVAALFNQIKSANGVAILGITGGDVSSAELAAQAKELEAMGVPTVAIVEAGIIKFVAAKYNGYDFLYSNGTPVRMVAFPTAFDGYPAATIQTYVNGNDPIENAPVVQEIIDALTKPLGQAYSSTALPSGISETTGGPAPAATPQPRLLPADTEDNLRIMFQQNDWTPNLPINLPTEAAVQAMEAGTSHSPTEVVYTSKWPGGDRKVTVENVAVAAVIAGCAPEDFPSCLAVAQQSVNALWGDLTGSWAYTIVFNGPIRDEIKINDGGGVLEPYAFANSVIGNFLTVLTKTCNNFHNAGASASTGTGILASVNSSVPQTNFRTIGSFMGEDNMCLAENEENLPEGWLPFSEQHGFAHGKSVVTLGIGYTRTNSGGELNQNPQPPADFIADYSRSTCGYGYLTVYIDPWVAQILHDSNPFKQGTDFNHVGALNTFPTKEAFANYLASYTNVTGFTVQKYWADSQVGTYIYPLALKGVQPYAGWLADLATNPGEIIAPYAYDPVTGAANNGANVNVIVTGGMLNTIWDLYDFRYTTGVDISTWE